MSVMPVLHCLSSSVSASRLATTICNKAGYKGYKKPKCMLFIFLKK
jgi:hypothetical protein